MQHLRLDAILTVVDAKHILLHLDEEKPDGIVNESVQQVGECVWCGVGGVGGRSLWVDGWVVCDCWVGWGGVEEVEATQRYKGDSSSRPLAWWSLAALQL